MTDEVDISDLPAPGADADISDLPTPPAEASVWGDIGRQSASDVKGAGMGIAALGESLYGLPISTLAKYATILSNEIGATHNVDPEAVRRTVLNHLVYQPTDRVGSAITRAAALPGRVIGAGVDKLADAADMLAPGLGEGVHEIATGANDALQLLPLAGVPRAVGAMRENAAADLSQRATAEATSQSLNAPRDEILARARARGLVVPPTAVNPSVTATAAESISGKAATRQAMQAKNSSGFNDIVRSDLGLPKDQPLTRDAIENDVIKKAGKSYAAVAKSGPIVHDDAYNADLDHILQVGPDIEAAYPGLGSQANEKVTALVDSLRQPQVDAKSALGAFKFLNNAAKDNFEAGFAGDPQALQLARAQRWGADALSDLIKRNLETNGDKALAEQWGADRIQIAKGYTALGALKGNNIDALNFARQLRKDKPLSGGFKLIGDFADQFPEVSSVPKSGAGVSKLAAAMAAEGVGALALHHPYLAATGAVGTVLPYAVRKGLLGDWGQKTLGAPSYNQRLLDLAQKYAPPAGPVAEAAMPDMFSLAPDAVPQRAADQGGIPLSHVMAGDLSLGEHAPPELTASAPAAPQTAPANLSPAVADYLSRGLELAPETAHAALHAPSDFAHVLASLVPEGTMARTARGIPEDIRLQQLAEQYGLPHDMRGIELQGPTLIGAGMPVHRQAAAIRQALRDQAGYADGGYVNQLHALRHYVSNLR